MPATELPDPFADEFQRCCEPVPRGSGYYTVVIDNKETHICEACYRELVHNGQIDRKNPAPYSPT
jgi:hypothetical protein